MTQSGAGTAGGGETASAASPARLRYGAAALSGVLLSAAFPPFGQSWLAWIALAPWFSVLLRDRGEGHRGPALVFGFLHFAIGLRWLADLWWAFPLLLAAFLALYPLLFAVLARWTSPLGPARTAALLPFLWVGTDLLRQHLFTGFPWLLPGHALAGHPGLRQAADLGGVHLLTFALVLASSALGLWGAHLPGGKRRIGVRAAARWGMAGAALLLPLALGIYGGARREGYRSSPGPRVLLVQPCFPQTIKKEALESLPRSEEMVRRQRALALEAVRKHAETDLVIWAETMVPGVLQARGRGGGEDPETRTLLHEIVDPVGVVPGGGRRFLGGAVLRGADRAKRNSVLLVGPRGRIEAAVAKERLVPFGEYLPLVDLLPGSWEDALRNRVRALSPFPLDLVPGDAKPIPIEVPGPGTVRLGCLVCYEVAFPGLARARAREGAGVLVNLSNYAWYGAGMREQALDLARFRAVECRRPVVVVTNDGPTAVLDGNGATVREIPPGTPGTLFAEVPLDGRRSLFLAAGDLFAWLAAAAGLAGVAAARRAARRGRGAEAGIPGGTLKNC